MKCPTCGKEMLHKALLTHPPQYQMSCPCGLVMPKVNSIDEIDCNGFYYMGGDIILFERHEWFDTYSRIRDGKVIANNVRMVSGTKTGPWLDTWKREEKAMREMGRFRIDSAEMRREMCAIFAVNEYPCVVDYTTDKYNLREYAFVVVYEKEYK